MALVKIELTIDDEEFGNTNVQELILDTLHDQCIYPTEVKTVTTENNQKGN